MSDDDSAVVEEGSYLVDSKDEFDEGPILDSSEMVVMNQSSIAVESELQEENMDPSEPLMFADVDPGAKIVSPIVCVELRQRAHQLK